MKKKFALILTTCILLTLLMTAFVGCNNNSVKVRVYTVCTAHDENPFLENTITIKKGSTFSKKYYVTNFVKDDGVTDGRLPSWGFYLDPTCKIKHDDDCVIEQDTKLYLLYCDLGSTFVVFHYENEEYYCYVDNTTAKLTADTFAVSAYSKTIDSSKLKYYSDEEMTQEVELVGKSFEELDVELSRLMYDTKHVYVSYGN